MTDQGDSRNARHAGTVIVFAGHMIDSPNRSADGLPPRFPADSRLERQIGERIARRLVEMNGTFGFCSVARGSDILFAESALELGIGLHIVIPFDLQDYVRTSVDCDSGTHGNWRARCDRVISRSCEVTQAMPGPYRHDDSVFVRANQLMCQLAVRKARVCDMALHGLLVIDRSSAALPGGTGDFMRLLNQMGIETAMIELKCGKLAIEPQSTHDSTGTGPTIKGE